MTQISDEADIHSRKAGTLRVPLVALTVVVSLAALGYAFYGWVQHGSAIFLALAENGLSWCF